MTSRVSNGALRWGRPSEVILEIEAFPNFWSWIYITNLRQNLTADFGMQTDLPSWIQRVEERHLRRPGHLSGVLWSSPKQKFTTFVLFYVFCEFKCLHLVNLSLRKKKKKNFISLKISEFWSFAWLLRFGANSHVCLHRKVSWASAKEEGAN